MQLAQASWEEPGITQQSGKLGQHGRWAGATLALGLGLEMRSVAIVLSGDRREREAPGKDMVRAAKVHVKQDSQSSRSLSQEEEVINRYKAPRRTLAGRRGLSGNTLFSP